MQKTTPLDTAHLTLLNCDIPTLEAVIAGDRAIHEHLDVFVPEVWSTFGKTSFQYALDRIKEFPEQAKWWTYLFVLKELNTLIGSGGYKGPPRGGIVEIGYEVAPDYRNQGYATEVVKALAKMAFEHPQVRAVSAQTLGKVNASTRVLEKSGFQKVNTLQDELIGEIWCWNLERPV